MSAPHAVNAVRTKVVEDEAGKFWCLASTDGLNWFSLHTRGYREAKWARDHAQMIVNAAEVIHPTGREIWHSDKQGEGEV